jgi:inhibitor of the pro-sigma K processing machinery
MLFGKIFFPVKILFKLIINSILGAVLLLAINYIGSAFNYHIGINFFTTIFVGVFGVPGAVLLIFLRAII